MKVLITRPRTSFGTIHKIAIAFLKQSVNAMQLSQPSRVLVNFLSPIAALRGRFLDKKVRTCAQKHVQFSCWVPKVQECRNDQIGIGVTIGSLWAGRPTSGTLEPRATRHTTVWHKPFASYQTRSFRGTVRPRSMCLTTPWK